MDNAERSPFYLRFGITVITLAVLALAVYFGKAILLPLLFSILLATLLLPIINKLQRWKINKTIAISLTLLTTLFLLGALIYFLATQIGGFFDDLPALQTRFKQLLWTAQKWVYDHFHIGFRQQNEYIEETTDKMNEQPGGIIGSTVLTLTGVISYVAFLPIYTFLILYHKDMIKKFLIRIFADGEESRVQDVLHESQAISQQYLTGLVIEFSIVFVLNTIGFLWLGIKYPVFLGFLSALLNIVPYIGMLIANIICIVVTLMSSANPVYAVYASGVLVAVQLVDNNILMPLIVGNKVKLNALAIILGVLVSGTLAGVAGMFLAIPTLAVLKIIFERVPRLQPWAILLGDETTLEEEKKNPVKNIFHRVRSKARKSKPTS